MLIAQRNAPKKPAHFVTETAEGGTRLTVRHHGYQHGEHWDWLHDAVVSGWKHVLDDMTAWFDRRNGGSSVFRGN